VIDTFASEADALTEVRGLLDAGWSADDLSVGRVGGERRDLLVDGEPLARLAHSADPGRRLPWG
jgi:hypothetical protein